MIYMVCPVCGYSIDIFTEEESTGPARSKRMKYLMTRDQVCPNCINTIGKCERVDAEEDNIPVIRVEVAGGLKQKFIEFCRKNGYAVGSKYALDHFGGGVN